MRFRHVWCVTGALLLLGEAYSKTSGDEIRIISGVCPETLIFFFECKKLLANSSSSSSSKQNYCEHYNLTDRVTAMSGADIAASGFSIISTEAQTKIVSSMDESGSFFMSEVLTEVKSGWRYRSA